MTLFCLLLLLCLGGKDPHFNACSYSSQDPKRKRNEKKDPLSRQTGIQLTRLPPLHHKKHYASYQPPQSCQHQACGEFYFLHTHTHTHRRRLHHDITSRHVTASLLCVFAGGLLDQLFQVRHHLLLAQRLLLIVDHGESSLLLRAVHLVLLTDTNRVHAGVS